MLVFFLFFQFILTVSFSLDIDLTIPNTTLFTTLYGPDMNHQFGSSVKSAGDVNGDDINDIVIGTPNQSSQGKANSGGIDVIDGRKLNISDIYLAKGLDNTQGFQIQGTESSTLGTSFSSAGDLNGEEGFDIVFGDMVNVKPATNIKMRSALRVLEQSNVSITGRELVQVILDVKGPAVLATKAAAMLISLLRYDGGSSLLFNFLFELLDYTRYLEINYPPRLQYMLEEPVSNLISINYLSYAPEKLKNATSEHSIPIKFEFYNLNSNFLINFWPAITMLLILFTITVLSVIMAFLTRPNKWLNDKFKKLAQSLECNFLLLMFIGYFCNLALYTSLEFRTIEFSSFIEGFSFAVCVVINLILIIALMKMYLVLRRIKSARKKAADTNNQEHLAATKADLQDFEVVFGTYKDDTLAQFYLIILSVRFYVFYLIIANLFSHPIIQTSIFTAMGLAFIIYIAIKRPFRKIKELITSFALEAILEIVNISALVLAITDHGDNENDTLRVVFGDIIIGSTFAFIIVSLVYTCVILVILLRDIFRFITKKKQVVPVKVFPLPEKANLHSSFVSNADTQRTLINDNPHQQSLSFKNSSDLSIVQDIETKQDQNLKDETKTSIPNRGNNPQEANVYRQHLHNDRSSRKMKIKTKSVDINIRPAWKI